jgi:hypothetical protein
MVEGSDTKAMKANRYAAHMVPTSTVILRPTAALIRCAAVSALTKWCVLANTGVPSLV